MAWCREATSHYLNPCWRSSKTPYDVTRPWWFKMYDSLLVLAVTAAIHHIFQLVDAKATAMANRCIHRSVKPKYNIFPRDDAKAKTMIYYHTIKMQTQDMISLNWTHRLSFLYNFFRHRISLNIRHTLVCYVVLSMLLAWSIVSLIIEHFHIALVLHR